MGRKVIIDCDPGIDDALALCVALFDPRLEVMAITAVEGNVSAHQSSRNVQAIIEQLDAPRLPRIGMASPPDLRPGVSGQAFHGEDGLGNTGFEVSELHHQHPSDKVICDVVRAAPEEVTIITLGPLTNVARAFQRDPQLPGLVGRLIMMGGSIHGVGNITPAAEYNVYYDPASARAVFRSPTTKTLVPLEVTNQVVFSLDFIDQMPEETTSAGRLMRSLLPFAFRVYRQTWGLEGIFLSDAVALMAAMHPELFETEYMAGDVEINGELTSGVTVFDRRPAPQWRSNMEVATEVDASAVKDVILRGMHHAGA